METNYDYTCPHCVQHCAVSNSLTGQNVLCPHCSQEFFATPPNRGTDIILPERLPFFKSGRKKLLEEHMQKLIADGELSAEDEQTLCRAAELLGLAKKDLNEIGEREFLHEFASIQKRVEAAWKLTDDDLLEIDLLKRKYGVKNFTMAGTANLFRRIYLMEDKGELPPPIAADFHLGEKERAYFSVSSTWQQSRVIRHGYSGVSMSVPSGIKGVRFRFGSYSPVRSDEITPLATGTLWVTSKRLQFNGDTRNTKIELRKIVDSNVFLDCIKVEKETGKPDYFSMDVANARYIAALIGAFKM